MNVTALHDVQALARHVEQSVARLEGLLPEAGEPPEVYALRMRVQSDDLKVATVRLADGTAAWVVYLETAVDSLRLYGEVLRPLQETAVKGTLPPAGTGHPLLPVAEPAGSLDAQAKKLVDGRAVVFAAGLVAAVDVEQFPMRTVSEPTTEESIVGSKEAFTENVLSNIGAVRHRIRDERLRVETYTVGRRSRTVVALLYLDDMANQDLVELTRQGLSSVDTDFIRTSNDIHEFLFGRSLTTVPLSEQTERPDRVAAAIAGGRISLIVDGTPFAIIVPTTLVETVKDSDSALPGPVPVLFTRCLRIVGELLSVSVAGLYVALMTADTPLLPTPLALAVSSSRNGVPYPVLTETVIMLVIIDIFSEATAQAPGGIGNTLSIVGTLIIGQMAVQARLASSLMMIVVASTALGSFLTLKYPYSYTLRVWKYPIVFLSGIAGLFGWLTGLLLLFTHLASLKSAGVPYLTPAAPFRAPSFFQTGITQSLKPDVDSNPRRWRPRPPRRPGGEQS